MISIAEWVQRCDQSAGERKRWRELERGLEGGTRVACLAHIVRVDINTEHVIPRFCEAQACADPQTPDT
eukprot:3387965-Rhodomonas_salina.1